MKNLELNNPYSREEIHAIFSPETKCTMGQGLEELLGLFPFAKEKMKFQILRLSKTMISFS